MLGVSPRPTPDELIHSLVWRPNRFSQIMLGQFKRPKKLLQQDLAGVCRLTISWNTYHGSLCQCGNMASPVGLEPTTCGLEVRCSVQLSYRDARQTRAHRTIP